MSPMNTQFFHSMAFFRQTTSPHRGSALARPAGRLVLSLLLLLGSGFVAGKSAASEPDPDWNTVDLENAELYVVEKVPFPVFDETADPTASEAVPVEPDTIAFQWPEEAGYVPDLYGKNAPEPASRLRPRYRPDLNSRQTTLPKPSTPSTIRQVAAGTFENAPPPPRRLDDGLGETFALPESRDIFAAGDPENNDRHDFGDLGCGGCATCGGIGGLRHLGDSNRLYRGHCDSCGLFTCADKIHGPWYVDGWLSLGATLNTHWPDQRDNAPLYYNDRNGEVVMNQLYLALGRRVDTKRGRWDWGGRIDLLYGSDYYYTSSLGLETRRYDIFTGQTTLDPLMAQSHWNANRGHRRDRTAQLYGLSLPQAYGELFVPIGNGVTFRAGHFYADMGLESAMAPSNFFYSHSYGFMYGAPVTLSGVTAQTKLGKNLTATVGATQGWNIWDSPTDHWSGLAGLNWQSRDKRTSLSFMLLSGADTLRGSDNRTNYTLTFTQRIGKKWSYALEHSFGYEKGGKLSYPDFMTEVRGPARWFSVAQYLQWDIHEKFALALRGEWFRDDGHSRIQKGAVSSPSWNLTGKDYFELTLGANWKPTRYITIRPEIRYDWSNVKINGRRGVYSRNTKGEMLTFAIDGIFRF